MILKRRDGYVDSAILRRDSGLSPAENTVGGISSLIKAWQRFWHGIHDTAISFPTRPFL
jgi:hypothetical protein